MFYKVLAGKHVDLDGTEYSTGEVIESEMDLCEIFPMKFEEVADHPASVQPPKKPKIPNPKGRGKKAPAQEEIDPLAVYGNDVTKKFEDSDSDVVLIYHKKGVGYAVIDVRDNKPFNEEPLKKAAVIPFLHAEVYEEDDDEGVEEPVIEDDEDTGTEDPIIEDNGDKE